MAAASGYKPSILVAALICLSGCAPHGTTSTAAAAPAIPLPGVFFKGQVVAIRPVDLTPQSGSKAGVDAVLAAVQVAAPAAPGTTQEIVVVRADGSPASLVGNQPGLRIGEPVAVIQTAAATMIDHD